MPPFYQNPIPAAAKFFPISVGFDVFQRDPLGAFAVFFPHPSRCNMISAHWFSIFPRALVWDGVLDSLVVLEAGRQVSTLLRP